MEHDLHLTGPVVTLVPLATAHAAALAGLGDAAAYAWHTSPLPLTPDTAQQSIEALLDDTTTLGFAVTSSSDGGLRGITSFYEHVPSVPRVEIGHTYYGRDFWGGDTNPHAKLLMLGHAFDTWSCERVALRCDADNTRSAGAIRRLGAQPEGVLRGHRRRHDGTVADTAYFSVLRAEWPVVRAGLLARTEPGA
ncbi:GNAT family N-acetyltransferase [Nocardioides panacis]|uniref:GNAT family N-acetyltransferase n=1 Tax=Nocardioides panacis TaxID=2849501 RepID=A0A975T1I4_9ACTN|nr:GNAT family protein [Nocardioides panacis]QWZ09821.1 GNAT family N-acetyltransferase [Nocardioides panacis]